MPDLKQTEVNAIENIGDVEKATVQVLDTVFEKLANQGNVKGDGPVRLFFPNGIELISAQVAVSPATGINFEVKIAGEKGIKDDKPPHIIAEMLPRKGLPVINSIQPGEVPLAFVGPVMIVGQNFVSRTGCKNGSASR